MTTTPVRSDERSSQLRFGTLADERHVQRAVAALEANGITILRAREEYAFPLEDARALEAYGIHSGVNKVLLINREVVPGRITVILVDEVLGF